MAIFIRLCIKYSNECVNMVCVVHVCIRNVFTHQLYILLKVNTVMFIELRNINSICARSSKHFQIRSILIEFIENKIEIFGKPNIYIN